MEYLNELIYNEAENRLRDAIENDFWSFFKTLPLNEIMAEFEFARQKRNLDMNHTLQTCIINGWMDFKKVIKKNNIEQFTKQVEKEFYEKVMNTNYITQVDFDGE